MRFTLSLFAALASGSDVTWSHELYDVEFIGLNQAKLTSVAWLRRVPRRTQWAVDCHAIALAGIFSRSEGSEFSA